MPVHTTKVPFHIHDDATLQFMEHCFTHWKDVEVCTDGHVEFMKHLVRSIFRLHHGMPLVGILFGDSTLAMLSPPYFHTFYVLTLDSEWTAAHVRVDGFAPQWGMETGFWDGLMMAESVIMDAESKGPAEE